MRKIVPDDALLVPEAAVKVFAGELFEVYQWEQELFDGSQRTFEMLRRPDTVVVIAIKDGKLVVIEDEQPGRAMRRTFPGGRVDPGEDWLTAAQRELLEETGLTFNAWRLADVVQPTTKIEWFVATFVASDFVSEVAASPGPGERIAVELADFNDVKNDPTSTLGQYPHNLFARCDSAQDLLRLPEFRGQEVDR